MFNNYTDSELINLQANTALESELMERLAGSTSQDWDDLKEREQKWRTKFRDSEEFAEKMRDVLKLVATEIHRCAEFGTIEITPEFRSRCQQALKVMDVFVAYEYPENSHPINSSSRFREDGFSMDTAPKDGTEIILQVKLRAGIPNKFLVGHYMPGGHCIEDHPPINSGWYFWNGCMFDQASEPERWWPIPTIKNCDD